MQLKKLKNNALKFIKRIENLKLPFLYWLVWLYGVFVLRGIAEGYLEAHHQLPKFVHLFVHWPFWNFNFLITIAFILFYFTRERIEKITKLVIAFSFLIVLVPVIDFLVSGGKGFILEYAMKTDKIMAILFSFGGLNGESIITPGQSAVIWTAIVLIGILVLLKTNSIKKTILSIISFYLTGVFYAFYPLILAIIAGLEPSFKAGTISITIFFLLLLGIIQSTLWLYFYNKKTILSLLKNLKPLRAGHYLGLTIIGAVFAVYAFPLSSFNFRSLIASLLAAFFAFESCLVYNNIYDKQIPRNITKKQYNRIGIGLLLFSFFFAALTNSLVVIFLFFAIIIGLYYSIPPFRLKRLGFLNNAIIGLLSSIVVGVGFLSQIPNLNIIPLNTVLTVFFTFSLASNIKDLKDFELDKKQRIKTLPVILGEKNGLKAIALLSSISFLIPPILLGFPELVLPGIILALLNFVFLNKTKKETVTFSLYFLFIALFGLAFIKII